MLTSLKNRLELLEAKQQPHVIIPLKDRIAEYVSIMDSGDYSSEEGRSLKDCIDKYGDVLEEIG